MSTDFSLIHTTSLREALGLEPGDLISLIGGGGKTSLMFRLAHEIAASGKCVISTTTTRILPPPPEDSESIILEEETETLIARLGESFRRYRHVTVARSHPDADKLKGLLPEALDLIHRLKLADYIVNEADGAACKPLKAPNLTEPVIPSSTSVVVAVVGVEVVGKPLLPENAFRIEQISHLTGLKEGELITTEAVSLLLTHPRGIIQHAPQVRIVPFINKAGEDQAGQAEILAAEILDRRHPQIERVVFGEVRRPNYPLTVVSLKANKLNCKP